jgi:Protein of unknown function (DUF2786)
MSTPETILTKVKLLLNLSSSSNTNESGNARAMADRLIAKYNITAEELKSLEEQPAKYGEDDLLFHTIRIVNWMQHLSLACAKHFFCYIVQETVKPGSGDEQYNYYVYGDDEDVTYVKFAFHTFHKKINELIAKKCAGRGPIYIESYCEGVIEAVKYNLSMDGLEMPEVKKPVINDDVGEKVLNTGHETLATVRPEPEKPEKETVDISKGTLIKDVAAYFKGVADGKNLSLQEILELEAENERVKELQGTQEEARGVPEV